MRAKAAWPGAGVVRRRLPLGNYALIHDERPYAVVERTTLLNLPGDLSELEGCTSDLPSSPRSRTRRWRRIAAPPP